MRTHALASSYSILAVLFVLPVIASAEVRYRVHLLEPLWLGTGPTADPAGINDEFQVCGRYSLSPAHLSKRWNLADGTYVDLGTRNNCPSSSGTPRAINALGHVAGAGSGGCDTEAWIWTPETGMISLGALPSVAPYSVARGMNNLDQVVGISRGPNGYEAFLWHESTGMVGLGEQPTGQFYDAYDINDDGWIVGRGFFDSFFAGVLWTPEDGMRRYTDIVKEPPDTSFGGRAINQHGQVAGTGYLAGQYGPALWDPVDGMRLLECPFCPPDRSVITTDINERTEIIGYVDIDKFPDEPFIWDSVRGMRQINNLFDPCAPWYARRIKPPTGINNHGWIVADILYTGGGDRTIPGAALIPYLPGDVDDDDDVDLHDLTQLLSNFGTPSAATLADGDVEGCDDEDVDLEDLIILLANFGERYP